MMHPTRALIAALAITACGTTTPPKPTTNTPTRTVEPSTLDWRFRELDPPITQLAANVYQDTNGDIYGLDPQCTRYIDQHKPTDPWTCY